MSVDPIEFGKVLGRLDGQDLQIQSLKSTLDETQRDVKHLVEIANQGKGGLLMLTTIAAVVGSIITWIASHLFRG